MVASLIAFASPVATETHRARVAKRAKPSNSKAGVKGAITKRVGIASFSIVRERIARHSVLAAPLLDTYCITGFKN
jgi:hypothetical protein